MNHAQSASEVIIGISGLHPLYRSTKQNQSQEHRGVDAKKGSGPDAGSTNLRSKGDGIQPPKITASGNVKSDTSGKRKH